MNAPPLRAASLASPALTKPARSAVLQEAGVVGVDMRLDTVEAASPCKGAAEQAQGPRRQALGAEIRKQPVGDLHDFIRSPAGLAPAHKASAPVTYRNGRRRPLFLLRRHPAKNGASGLLQRRRRRRFKPPTHLLILALPVRFGVVLGECVENDNTVRQT